MDKKNNKVSVVGAGLAGSECAWQLAELGYLVDLYEMRDQVQTPAHKTSNFAELVCSNSFGSQTEGSAPFQLKWEAAQLNSLILKTAQDFSVPAGQSLSVDREKFAEAISGKVKSHPNIVCKNTEIKTLDQISRPAVLATGPLTSMELAQDLQKHFSGDFLYFFDAIAPIIDVDSINMDIAWKADRYDKGTADYINCPLNKEQYLSFVSEVQSAKKIEPKHFETTQFFEGCMPIETMIDRGPQTLRFGPMKPVGLKNPREEREPYAVVQLRQDNKEGTAFNMVGFQTRMTYGEQARIFRMIPGLENAEFLKLGSIHRNLFINSPILLNKNLSSKNDSQLFFAGQITGVEGYFESTCIGLLVAHFVHQQMTSDSTSFFPPRESAMGSLLEAITSPERAKHFQPTNINFGLLPPLADTVMESIGARNKKGILRVDKNKKKEVQIENAKKAFTDFAIKLKSLA